MHYVKVWLISFCSLAVLDLLWIHGLAAGFYFRYLAPLSRVDASGGIAFRVLPGVIAFALMALAFTVFLSGYERQSFKKYAGRAALLGLVVYGIFDCTNLSFMSYWPVRFAVADMFWGTASFAVTAAVLKLGFL